MAFKDKVKAKEYYKKWREAHKDSIKKYSKVYRQNPINKKKQKEYSKFWSRTNIKKILDGRRSRNIKCCPYCKKTFGALKKKQRFCSRKCFCATLIPKHYKFYKHDGKMMSFHRYVMEQHIGRKLTSEEVVHHINGNKLDNRIENLQLFSSDSEHIAHHRKTQPERYPGKKA